MSLYHNPALFPAHKQTDGNALLKKKGKEISSFASSPIRYPFIKIPNYIM